MDRTAIKENIVSEDVAFLVEQGNSLRSLIR